jgi:hypothetical protein
VYTGSFVKQTLEKFIYLGILRYTGDTMVHEALITTIKLNEKTKSELDSFREYKNESYDEVIKKVIYIAKHVRSEPKLSKDTLQQIELARARIKAGNFLTEEEAKKRLGL